MMGASRLLPDLQERMQQGLMVSFAPPRATFAVVDGEQRLEFDHEQLYSDGFRLEGQRVKQLFFSEDDSIKAFWFYFKNRRDEIGARQIVWRVVPEITEIDDCYFVYARFRLLRHTWGLASE